MRQIAILNAIVFVMTAASVVAHFSADDVTGATLFTSFVSGVNFMTAVSCIAFARLGYE